MKTNKKNNLKTTVSKGYRLKPSTHKLIKQVQRSLNATQDRILSTAIKLFRKESEITGKQKVNK
jgi:hypothetical protein